MKVRESLWSSSQFEMIICLPCQSSLKCTESKATFKWTDGPVSPLSSNLGSMCKPRLPSGCSVASVQASAPAQWLCIYDWVVLNPAEMRKTMNERRKKLDVRCGLPRHKTPLMPISQCWLAWVLYVEIILSSQTYFSVSSLHHGYIVVVFILYSMRVQQTSLFRA